VLNQCLSWSKFVNTHLYHSSQWFNIHITDFTEYAYNTEYDYHCGLTELCIFILQTLGVRRSPSFSPLNDGRGHLTNLSKAHRIEKRVELNVRVVEHRLRRTHSSHRRRARLHDDGGKDKGRAVDGLMLKT